MQTTHRTSQSAPTASHWTIRQGFVPEAAALPLPRIDVPLERRECAAQMILAVAYGATPEDIVLDAFYRAEEVADAFERAEDRAETLAHVDLLLDALLPR